MIWVDHVAGRYYLTLGGSSPTYLDSGPPAAVGQWEHVAATYDGATARFYVDGVEVASKPFTGNVGNSNTWRLGAYGNTPAGFFDGLIDNVRIYDRALSAAEIQTDMASRIQRDDAADGDGEHASEGAAGVNAGDLGDGHLQRADEGEHDHLDDVPAEDAVRERRSRRRSPTTRRRNATLETAERAGLRRDVHGDRQGRRGGVTDAAGNALAAKVSWSFTVEASPPQSSSS